MDQNKGWYSRGYLPHFDHAYVVQGITIRLHGSLPEHVVEQMNGPTVAHAFAIGNEWIAAGTAAVFGVIKSRRDAGDP